MARSVTENATYAFRIRTPYLPLLRRSRPAPRSSQMSTMPVGAVEIRSRLIVLFRQTIPTPVRALQRAFYSLMHCAGKAAFRLILRWTRVPLCRGSENVLSSSQRGFHAHARHTRSDACASHQALVAIARTQHLPAKTSARSAHPHST